MSLWKRCVSVRYGGLVIVATFFMLQAARRLPTAVEESAEPCLACGAQRWLYRFRFGTFQVKQCQACGLGQTDPLPTGSQQAEANQSIYTVEQRLQTYRTQQRRLAARYSRQLKQIEALHKGAGKQLLDVGCSLGVFVSFAIQRGYAAQGVELSQETGQYARDHMGLPVFIGTLNDAGYSDQSFDIITLWDVLEHVPDPVEFLTDIKRILRPDGILAIQSPNIQSSMVSLLGERWNWWTIPDHIWHFSPNALQRLLTTCGFKVAVAYTWEPSREFLENMLAAVFHLDFTNRRLTTRLAGKLVSWSGAIGWPLLIPFQRMNWRKQRGGLIVVYARNEN